MSHYFLNRFLHAHGLTAFNQNQVTLPNQRIKRLTGGLNYASASQFSTKFSPSAIPAAAAAAAAYTCGVPKVSCSRTGTTFPLCSILNDMPFGTLFPFSSFLLL